MQMCENGRIDLIGPMRVWGLLDPLDTHSLSFTKEFTEVIVTECYLCQSPIPLMPQGMSCGSDPSILAFQGPPDNDEEDDDDNE